MNQSETNLENEPRRAPPPPPPVEKTEPKENFFREILRFSIIALLIVLPVRVFIAQPFIVSGASMEPTFENGEYLIIDELSYRFEPPKRGEVVIFRYPKDPSKFFIKRIIGLPDETVELRGSKVIIHNQELPGGFTIEEPYLPTNVKREDYLTTTLRDNEYFVLGDNRGASSDSRIWGTLPAENITGRAIVRLLPITRISVFPGDATNATAL
ncbi:signal peptidase I [Candidatus Kaiserbacteria bacterium RIFCSPHIGHO2_01_FULL_49_13]|uniref:Signal peptidase I n=1 Tax=Candidatus Kaiserbacteria bacterium RIFCSPHIGHO2_01_FULL_49_13 TaxID=1798477 RepID=A0A1F6CEH4_9BACT|nr:MAG: signal peptidase I [Candidatus Kaiserbacteria bacterium RIFCSPHIGHO2_01_FULL_49_13]